MSVFGRYKNKAANLGDEMFLGQVVFFTISENEVKLEDLRSLVAKLNLKDDTLKKKIRPVDAFKKAVGEVAVKFPRSATSRNSILVRPVGQDSTTSHRHIVLERAVYAAGKRRQLEYSTLATVVYDRGTRQKDGTIINDSIDITVNAALGASPDEQAWISSKLGDGSPIQDRYVHWTTHCDSNAVRSFVRDYLLAMGAVQLKSNGGVYFVPQKHIAELRDLATLTNGIGSHMHLVPLVDIVDQRDMLLKAFETEAVTEMDVLMSEVAEIMSDQSRTIRPATYDDYEERLVGAIQKIDQYRDLLDDSLDGAHLRVVMADAMVKKLSGRVKVPRRMQSV